MSCLYNFSLVMTEGVYKCVLHCLIFQKVGIFFLNTETLFVIKNVKTLMSLSVEEENERKCSCGNLM